MDNQAEHRAPERCSPAGVSGSYDSVREEILPRMSVVVPTYNMAGTILTAIRSVLDQVPQPFEVVIVDDGSADDTETSLAVVRDEVKYVRQRNGGVASARNTGLALCSGELIAFLDADDYWLPGFVVETTRFLSDHPQLGAVSTGFYEESNLGRLLRPSILTSSPARLATGPVVDPFECYRKYRHIWTGAVVVRKEAIHAAGLFRTDLRVGEDIEYWLRLATVVDWGFIARPLAVYNVSSPQSLTRGAGSRRLIRDVRTWESDIVPRLKVDQKKGYESLRCSMSRTLFRRMLADNDVEGARGIWLSGYLNPPPWAKGVPPLLLKLGPVLGPALRMSAVGARMLRRGLSRVRSSLGGSH